jgi:hypothetical protein
MRTARLSTESFTIQCPHCEELQEHAGTGSQQFTPSDVEPGQEMRCTSEGCKKLFRLPKKLEASAE